MASNNTPQKNILELVLDGDLEGVREYFNDDAHDVNRVLNGATALHVTAYSNDPATILPVFYELIQHKADLEIKATIGRNVPDMTPLHFACAFNKTELALAMMDAGANVNALDGHGQTPLIRAVQNRNELVIDGLLNHGADATISTSRGATPLILLADPIPEDEGRQDWERDADIAKKMMKANVNVNAVDEDGLSALHWAAQSGHAALVSVLLDEGMADVDIINRDGQTPLFMTTVQLLSQNTPPAQKERLYQVLDTLVEHDANENLADTQAKRSPFNLARDSGRPDLMKRMDRHIEE